MAALVYATVGSNRLDDAKAFYDALLGSAGIKPVFEHPSGGRVYGASLGKSGRRKFMIDRADAGPSGPAGGGLRTGGSSSRTGFATIGRTGSQGQMQGGAKPPRQSHSH